MPPNPTNCREARSYSEKDSDLSFHFIYYVIHRHTHTHTLELDRLNLLCFASYFFFTATINHVPGKKKILML